MFKHHAHHNAKLNGKAAVLNQYTRVVLEPLSQAICWKHQGFSTSDVSLFLADRVHFNLSAQYVGFLYMFAPLCRLLYLCPTMRAIYIYAPLRGLFMFMPHYAGFLHWCLTTRVFYIYAQISGLFIFSPTMGAFYVYAHYAGFLYLCPTMRAFIWPLRGRTPGDNKMSALPVPVKTSIGSHIS